MKKTLSAALCAALLLLTACRRGADAAQEIRPPVYGADEIKFEVAAAQYMDLSETQSIGATVGYPYAVYVTYPADALVMSYDTAVGREVKQGDVIAQLDSSGLDYDINNQQTLVNASRGSQLDYALEQSRLDMLLAEKDAYTLRAPFDGIITYARRLTEGSDAAAGDVCFAISEKDRAMVYIDGADASRFRFGQKVQVRLDGTTYDATVVQAPDTAPADQTVSRTIFALDGGVMAQLAEENPLAISAGWATVYLTTEKKNVLAVPDSAIKRSGSTTYVTLVDGEERFKLNVTVGESIGGYTEIIDGISEGDVVMAQGSGVFSGEDSADEQQNAQGGFDGHDGPPPDWNGEFPE